MKKLLPFKYLKPHFQRAVVKFEFIDNVLHFKGVLKKYSQPIFGNILLINQLLKKNFFSSECIKIYGS